MKGHDNEIQFLREENEKLKSQLQERTRQLVEQLNENVEANVSLERQTFDLKRKLRFLDCLFNVSNILNSPVQALEDVMGDVARIIRVTCNVPGCAGVRISFNNGIYLFPLDFKADEMQPAIIQEIGEGSGNRIEMFNRQSYSEKAEKRDLEEVISTIAAWINNTSARQGLTREIRKRNDFLETVLDTIPGPVFYKNAANQFLGCNSEFEKLFKLKRNEIIGKTLPELRADDINRKHHEADFGLMENPGKTMAEDTVWSGSGEEKHYITYKNVHTGENGRGVILVGVMHEVTKLRRLERELKQINEKLESEVMKRTMELTETNKRLKAEIIHHRITKKNLEESEQKYRAVFENANEGIALFDAETMKLVDLNRQAHESLGYTREEMLELRHDQYSDYDDEEEKVRMQKDLMAKGRIKFMEKQLTKSGSICYKNITGSLISINGKAYVIAVSDDITDLVRKEQLLKQSRQRLIDFQDRIPIGIFQTNMKGDFLYLNKAAVKMFGYESKKEMMTQPVAKVYANPHERDEFLRELRENGQLVNKQLQAMRKDGSVYWGVLNVRTVYNNQGAPVRFDGVIQDITERVETQMKLERANSEIAEINETLEKRIRRELKKRQKQQRLLIQKSKLESLGELAAGIAHEINQPLGVLALSFENMYDKITRMEADTQYLEEKYNSIYERIERIREIINHIRLFSRDQASVVLEKIDVNQAILNSISMIRVQYETHGISIKTDLQDNLGFTVGSLVKVEQVLMNLFSNARYAVERKMETSDEFDYMKTIAVSTSGSDEFINIDFEDNGTGIDGNIMSKIFDPFFTTKEEGLGTGLGLSIVYGIVREMNGDIKIRSRKGVYTVVTISFPRFK